MEPTEVRTFLMHQANRNLTDRVAKVLEVPSARFFSNIQRYGNTSSASLLIAASEWREETSLEKGDCLWVCFAAFGRGFHWGATVTAAVAAGKPHVQATKRLREQLDIRLL